MSKETKRSVLCDKKSIKKKANVSNIENKVCLPFPVPLVQNNGCVVWPLLKSNGFLRFSAIINRLEKCCEVNDGPSALVLASTGFFGSSPLVKVDYNSVYNDKVIKDLTKTSVEDEYMDLKESTSSRAKDKSELYKQSFLKAFHKIPEKKKVISDLYGSEALNCVSDSVLYDSENSSNILVTASNREHKLPLSITLDEACVSPQTLSLDLEEAFFLSYGVGVLDIFSDKSKLNQKLDLIQSWSVFCDLYNESDATEFAVRYAVYHYFRAKGWIVKSGLQFGSDYLLYKEGPPFYHSLFSISIVKQISSKMDIFVPQLSWQYLLGFHRVTNCVSKHSILCFVTIPADIDNNYFRSPTVIQQFNIQTLLMERWVPSEQRENDEYT